MAGKRLQAVRNKLQAISYKLLADSFWLLAHLFHRNQRRFEFDPVALPCHCVKHLRDLRFDLRDLREIKRKSPVETRDLNQNQLLMRNRSYYLTSQRSLSLLL